MNINSKIKFKKITINYAIPGNLSSVCLCVCENKINVSRCSKNKKKVVDIFYCKRFIFLSLINTEIIAMDFGSFGTLIYKFIRPVLYRMYFSSPFYMNHSYFTVLKFDDFLYVFIKLNATIHPFFGPYYLSISKIKEP